MNGAGAQEIWDTKLTFVGTSLCLLRIDTRVFQGVLGGFTREI